MSRPWVQRDGERGGSVMAAQQPVERTKEGRPAATHAAEIEVRRERRAVPRRPGSASARFIDRQTALPNRMALLTEVNFALAHFPYWVAIVMVEADPPDLLHGVGGDGATEVVLAAADRLRDTIRPTDFVGRIGRYIVGAAMWGWEQADQPNEALGELIHSAFSSPLTLPVARRSPAIQLGMGVAKPGQSGTVALTAAWCAMRFSKPLRP